LTDNIIHLSIPKIAKIVSTVHSQRTDRANKISPSILVFVSRNIEKKKERIEKNKEKIHFLREKEGEHTFWSRECIDILLTISLSIYPISLSVKVDGKEEDYVLREKEYLFAILYIERRSIYFAFLYI
jgi:hypothetical protein